VHWRRRCPYIFVGWFWYLGMLTPVLGLVQVAAHAMADRYMYLPGIGLYIALAWGTARLAADSAERRFTLSACAALAIVVLVTLAAWQTSFWRDDETLWRHALACTPENSEAEFSLAEALDRQGRRDDAVAHYRRAQKGATDFAPFNSLGRVFAVEGNYDEAITQFRRALEFEPNSALIHTNLGMALSRQGRADEAREHFRRALEIDPRDARAHRELAHLLSLDQNTDEARAELEQAVELDPRDTVARGNLGSVLLEQGKIDAAIAAFEAALAIDPKSLGSRINLARALAARGRIDEAIVQYREALRLDPNNSAVHEELEKLLRGDDNPPAP
jgi:Tfp pilus assembly protein PilF